MYDCVTAEVVRQNDELTRKLRVATDALVLAADRWDDLATIVESNGPYTNVGFFRCSAQRCRNAAQGIPFLETNAPITASDSAAAPLAEIEKPNV